MRAARAALAAALTLVAAPLAHADDAGSPIGSVLFNMRSPVYSGRGPRYIQALVARQGKPGLRAPTTFDFGFGFDGTTSSEVTGRVHRGADVLHGDLGLGLIPAPIGSSFKLDLTISDLSHRSDSLLAPAVPEGAEGTYDLGHGLWIGLDLDDDEPAVTPLLPRLASVTGRIGYDLFPASPLRATLFVGCGATWIDLEGSQTLANHVQERAGPILMSGVSVSF